MTYGYALSADSERWSGSEDTVEAAIYEALTELTAGAADPVFICDVTPPDISYRGLADDVLERIEGILYEEVGEVADTFGPFEESEIEELGAAIKGWCDKHGDISCWKAENIRKFERGDSEYDAAFARLTAYRAEHSEATWLDGGSA